jgi:hypothetical protein
MQNVESLIMPSRIKWPAEVIQGFEGFVVEDKNFQCGTERVLCVRIIEFCIIKFSWPLICGKYTVRGRN